MRCGSCNKREATITGTMYLGVMTVCQRPFCEPCAAAFSSADDLPTDLDSLLTKIGPIDFDTVRESMRAVEASATAEELAGTVAGIVRSAHLHSQLIPPDVKAFVERHSAPTAHN
jgi:hypothetical protein